MKGGALSRHRLNHILKDGPVHFELDKILGFASRVYLKEKIGHRSFPCLVQENVTDG
jgi:hypothetical protein